MRILTIGFGRLGQRVAAMAASAGDDVYGLRRSRMAHEGGRRHGASQVTEGQIRPIQGDVSVPSSLHFPAGLDHILYCVAASEPSDEGYAAAYPAGLTNALVAAQIGSPSAQLTFVSSTSVYGQDRGEQVDEESPTVPVGFRGRRMVEAERVAASWPGVSTSCRLSGIYGPDRTRLLDSVREGRARFRSGVHHWTNRIHEEDAARAIWHVMGQSSPPQILCVTDREPTPRREVLEWLAEEIAAKAPSSEEAALGAPPESGKRISSERLVSTGFLHRYPSFREGYADVIAGPG